MNKPFLHLPAWLAYVLCGLLLVMTSISRAAAGSSSQTDNVSNPRAVAEVQSGQRATANAAWWGFHEEDATDALQAAIRSGAKRVSVPNLDKDWIVRPLQLASDQELVFETGAVITAMRGA